ncbi:hypothetical protein Rhopal_003608-T1 [Rhodotorula paludigena]|uniref:sphingolipid C(9)-methyltransferase n=1 Tax=Rhodotorula paludigena TaxID=86838 RepID=A0AAV5GM47_9BASI|nr:hypothetical protein Rhopal_003608-T1 [Rhodotorula paludigena]
MLSHVGLKVTNRAAIANAPFAVEGNGAFSNYQLAALVLFVPYFLSRFVPFVSFKTAYFFLLVVTGVPTTIAYWLLMSRANVRLRDNGIFPGKNLEDYITINDPELREKYNGQKKIPMQVFHDAYFDGKIDIKGDMLELLEWRHDWASFVMTIELMKYVLTRLIPDVIFHSAGQDEDQVTDHYDRGDDFHEWFLGPRMIYTSGIIGDVDKKETLEELQDNKLATVCHKLQLKPEDRLLDIGCGWGTLVTYAAKNFGCDATGVTLSHNQAEFGNNRIAKNGVDPSRARILRTDFRNLDKQQKFTKIVTLEMAEHVGIRRYNTFLKDVYNLLDDDGILVYQVAGLRPTWQYEDLVWGLFMNKYVFPGADASCALNWVIGRLEGAGFEVTSCDVIGVHYSATLHRWYENWIKNADKVKAKYGEKWYRTWLYFLASSTIVAREGGSSAFQITLHKNLNSYHRVEDVMAHSSVHPKLDKEPK